VLGDKGMDGLCFPRRADAIGQIEGPGNLAAKAVDLQRNTAHLRISNGRVDLGRNPLIGSQPRGLPDPRAAMHQSSGDLDQRNTVDQCEELGVIVPLPLCNAAAD